ncbi:MAG TPA: hypothetical protein VKG20_21525 [Methylomirabilota bacterium]|nr:hypothetical protein [Methylomirabilota bacterium]
MLEQETAARRNGLGAPMPIKTVEVLCDDAGYPGWHASLRTNVRSSTWDDFISSDVEKFWRSLERIVVAWNFADEDGAPLPTPAEGLKWQEMPFDLAQFLVRRYIDEFNRLTAVPKASDSDSAPTSRTSGDPAPAG